MKHLKPNQLLSEQSEFRIALFVFLAIIIFRRPSQFLNPYVWDEDGNKILPNIVREGFLGVFEPINGYLNVSAGLINYLSLKLSFLYQPFFSYWITLAFTFLLVTQISRKLEWRWSILLVTSIFMLVPSDPEVYAVGLYSFWLIGVFVFLLMLLILQSKSAPGIIDTALLFVALISSPFAWSIYPFFLLLLVLRDKKRALSPFVFISLGAFVIQGYFIFNNSTEGQTAKFLTDFSENFFKFIPVFFGNFMGSGFSEPTRSALGLMLLAYILVLLVLLWKQNWRSAVFLLLVGGIAIFLSWYRVPIWRIHPQLAGPRYFFYPYVVMLTCLLLVPLFLKPSLVKPTLFANIAIVALSLVLNFQILQRKHYVSSWSYYASACYKSDKTTSLRVFFNGYLNNPWQVSLTPEMCQNLADSSLFDRTMLIAPIGQMNGFGRAD